jgi:molecular chaperone HscB
MEKRARRCRALLFGLMNLSSTDFELFDIAPRFELDRAALDARWLALQAEVHPDKFATEGAAAQRVAMQWAVRVNEAYQRLKDPLQRAAYLCELNGAVIEAENNTAMPREFLVQQMEWREALDDAADAPQVEALADEVAAHRRAALVQLQNTLDNQRDFKAAAQQVRALMFVERFAHDIDRRLEALGQ